MPAKKKKDESLEESLASSATKKGLSGADKKQYIGGAITNMRKKGRLPARAGAKKAAPRVISEDTLIKMRGKLQVRERQIELLSNRKRSKEDEQTLKQFKEEARILREKLADPKLNPKAPAPKAAEKPKEEEKNYSVHMDVLPGKTGPGMKAHREYDNLSEQEAKNMVNQYGSIVFMKRIVVYKGGKKLRGWAWNAKEHRLVEMKR